MSNHMSILELLRRSVREEEFFFFSANSGAGIRENMRRVAESFLATTEDGPRDDFARQLTYLALFPHAKGEKVASMGQLLNFTELYGKYEHKLNRRHLAHSVNTFLLGLLIFHKVSAVRDHIINEIKNSTKRYSGGSEFGEFLFRWRIASLMHDLGNGISLSTDDEKQIDEYIFGIMIRVDPSYGHAGKYDIEYLHSLSRGKRTLEELDRLDGADRIQQFYRKLKEQPLKGKIYYDHGVISAMICLKVIDYMYDKHEWGKGQVAGGHVSYDPEFFDCSVVSAAHAISLHNIDFYGKPYIDHWPEKIYDVEKQPLAFLLKVSDTLQEWDKTRAKGSGDYIHPDQIEISMSDHHIEVVKSPKIVETREKFDKFVEGRGILKI